MVLTFLETFHFTRDPRKTEKLKTIKIRYDLQA